MKAMIVEIQVGGGKLVHSLTLAAREYVEMMKSTDGYRAKINFTIKLPNGEIKSITIRDEDDETVAYGNFDGLPNALDYAQEVVHG